MALQHPANRRLLFTRKYLIHASVACADCGSATTASSPISPWRTIWAVNLPLGAAGRLRVERVDDRLRALCLTPKLADYITNSYHPQLAASGKRASSIEKQKSYLKRWSEKIGHLLLNKLRAHHLNRFLTELANDDFAGRSINLFLIAIRSALKAALRDGHLKPPLPYEGLAWHRVDTKSRPLYSPAEIDLLRDVARQASNACADGMG
jgi:hypothetical protein